MQTDSKDFQKLRDAVEKTAGFKLKTHKDFLNLTQIVLNCTRSSISYSTLKRFWGVMDAADDSFIRESTLDILARFVGYISWQAFVSESSSFAKNPSSTMVNVNKLETKNLRSGQKLVLRWLPDRKVTVRFEGMDLFRVLANENSKLPVDTTFHCSLFVEHCSCFMTCVYIAGNPPRDYICGENGGITFEVVE